MNFDQHLNQVLENLEVPYEPETWALLQHRLDGLIAEEHPVSVDPIDKVVYHTLERLEAPYQSAHWELLAQRMQLVAVRLRRLRLAKVSEAAILLLLLVNLNLFPAFSGYKNPAPPKVFHPDVPVADAGSDAKGHTHGRYTFSSKNTPLTAGSREQLALAQAATGSWAPDLLSDDYKKAANISSVLQGLNQVVDQANKRIYVGIPGMDMLSGDVLAAINIPNRQADMPPAAPVRKYATRGPVYFSTFAATDQNQVLVDGARRWSPGYGAGVAVGMRRGKWGVEAGAVYGQNDYEPHQTYEFYKGNVNNGYYVSTLTHVRTSMVSVPVKVNRQIARVGNTTARATAGLTANFAVQKDYDYGTIAFNDPNPPSGQTNPGNPKLRQAGRGILEQGGSFKGNVYATLDAGIRIEQPIGRGRRYTAFIEPSFRQSLTRKGVGPNREPVNSLTLQAGVMAFL